MAWLMFDLSLSALRYINHLNSLAPSDFSFISFYLNQTKDMSLSISKLSNSTIEGEASVYSALLAQSKGQAVMEIRFGVATRLTIILVGVDYSLAAHD